MRTVTNKKTTSFFIAAVGASAGGLEALQNLLSNLPKALNNIAFIVVQHLSAKYKSMLVQSLVTKTSLEVIEVKNTVTVKPGVVYITPAGHEVVIRNGKLYLLKPEPTHGPHPSINVLFNSLAKYDPAHTIAIILSGTGSDGAEGLGSIKRTGGMTIVQDPASAKFNSMPLAAIEGGSVDHILTPENIGAKIYKLLNPRKATNTPEQRIKDDRDKDFQEIIKVLSRETGTDFNNYKHNTILRRITRRMDELKMASSGKYLKFLEENKEEIENLYHHILIGVTSFFRDGPVFKVFEKKLEFLIKSKSDNAAIRVWIPGCSTGEEVYSVAMSIDIILQKKDKLIPVQIFATDINARALAIARKGMYLKKHLRGIPADRLKNYFTEIDDQYEVNKKIRSMILFSKHDLTHNPPFLKLDLIVCRNLLIYFNTRLQEYIFPVFYSALNVNGFLLLGKSESIGHFNQLFSIADREAKIYQRKAGKTLHPIHYTPVRIDNIAKQQPDEADVSISDLVKETVQKLYKNPYVVINDGMDIQEINGDVSLYLGLKHGQMNASLIKLAHPDIKIELRSLINKCLKENEEITGSIRKIQIGKKEHFVKISIIPLTNGLKPIEFYMIIFEEVIREKRETEMAFFPAGKEDSRRIKELELDLEATKEDLQQFVDRLESSNAALQSLNEEMQSTNEEFKISNEELETANEELQSTNEEINIAYTELKSTYENLEIQEAKLFRSETNVTAMLGNTLQSFILLDNNYEVVASNKMAKKTFQENFRVSLVDAGNFKKLLPREIFKFFANDFDLAFKGKTTQSEFTFNNVGQKPISFLVTITPVFNRKHQLERYSLSLLDITELRKVKIALEKTQKLMDTVFHTADIGIAILDRKGRFIKVNDGLNKLLGYEDAELIGKPYHKIIPVYRRPATKTNLKKMIDGDFLMLEDQLAGKDGIIVECIITSNLLKDENDGGLIVNTFRNITERKKYKDMLTEAETTAKLGGYQIDFVTNKMIWTDEMYRIYEVDPGLALLMDNLFSLLRLDNKRLLKKMIKDASISSKDFDVELELVFKDKRIKWVRVTGRALKNKGTLLKVIGTVQDITERKMAVQQLQRLSVVAKNTNNAVVIMDAAGNTEWVNDSFIRMSGYELKEVVGKRPGFFLEGPETDPKVIKKLRSSIKNKRMITEVVKYYHKDGTAFMINLNVTPVFEDNNIMNFIALGIDITAVIEARENQLAKEVLQQRQRLFEGIARNFPDGIIGVLDHNLKYIFAGGAEIKKLGLTRQHLIGEKIFDSLSPVGNNESEPFLRKAFKGENVLFEEKIKENVYTVNAVPLFSGARGVEQILIVLHNITKRKNAELELWQALDKQRELNDLKSKFVSIASHEFRTPLSGILSSAYLVSKYNELRDDEKVKKHIGRISDSVRTLTDILNDFLSLGKIEEGKLENNLESFDLVEFCEKLIDEMRPVLKTGQSFVYKKGGVKRLFSLDKNHLRHILVNMLSNAIKYSEEGQKIKLTTTVSESEVKISLEDKGIGIPEEDQRHLFQTFFRAHNAINIQGTGMGLHIVKRFVDIMGGTISFSSKQDRGTTFTIQFPAKEK